LQESCAITATCYPKVIFFATTHAEQKREQLKNTDARRELFSISSIAILAQLSAAKNFPSTSRIFCYHVRAHYTCAAGKPHGGPLVFTVSYKSEQRQQASQQGQCNFCCNGTTDIACFGWL
jgi:hypothetical protein